VNQKSPIQSESIISIDSALHLLKSNIPERVSVNCPLHQAAGKYLAEDIQAPEPSPRFTNSAMDGFAVRFKDVEPVQRGGSADLKIVGESQAGKDFQGNVGPGEAIRISTGAFLANDCDTVIRVEDTEEDGNRVRVKQVKCQGQDVRQQGEEFHKGETLLGRGTRVAAPEVALLASVGIGEVKIYRPCRVALLITGSELVSAGESVGRHQIRDSNMIMLEAAVTATGAEVSKSVLVHDDEEKTAEAISAADADLVVCTGGVSVGRHDHVKSAAISSAYTPIFWRIHQKPGKPLFFARKENQLLFGLPGNPVSAFMCFTHYVRPLLGNLHGQGFGWPTVSGEAALDIANNGNRTTLMRVRLRWQPNGGYLISDAAKQGSHMLTSLSGSDGYIILPPGQTLERGQRIDVYQYDYMREPV
jgi:molybdopterin molybdotransferase